MFGAESISLRERKGRNTEHGAFHRAGNGAGIGHVFRAIAAAIDAGEDEIRFLFHDVTNAHNDAVRRCTFYGEMPLADFPHAERVIQ